MKRQEDGTVIPPDAKIMNTVPVSQEQFNKLAEEYRKETGKPVGKFVPINETTTVYAANVSAVYPDANIVTQSTS